MHLLKNNLIIVIYISDAHINLKKDGWLLKLSNLLNHESHKNLYNRIGMLLK